jgi:hypothetical protein
MGAFHWTIARASPLAPVLSPGTRFGWPLRLAQGAVSVAAGLVAARLARRSVHAVWLVPFAIVAARLLLDPLGHDYYYAGLEGPALCAAALLAAGGLQLGARDAASPATAEIALRRAG